MTGDRRSYVPTTGRVRWYQVVVISVIEIVAILGIGLLGYAEIFRTSYQQADRSYVPTMVGIGVVAPGAVT